MNICVYGASSDQIAPEYMIQTEKLGAAMAARGHGLVFGGGAHGLMGAVARGVASGGGTIIGVAPHFFQSEGILFDQCTELIRTETMRERKQTMEARSDAFIMTPGGIGTFEEFFEILTLRQLGRHNKPIGVLNIRGYYDVLQTMLQQAIDEGFLSEKCRDLYLIESDPLVLLEKLEQAPVGENGPLKPI